MERVTEAGAESEPVDEPPRQLPEHADDGRGQPGERPAVRRAEDERRQGAAGESLIPLILWGHGVEDRTVALISPI